MNAADIIATIAGALVFAVCMISYLLDRRDARKRGDKPEDPTE